MTEEPSEHAGRRSVLAALGGLVTLQAVPAASAVGLEADFSYDPEFPSPEEEVTLNGSLSTHEDGSISDYRWEVETSGGGTRNLYSRVEYYQWDTAGAYDVTLTITGDAGSTDTVTKTVQVQNAAPEPVVDASSESPEIGETVTFDARDSTDSDGSIVEYRWTFENTNGQQETTYGDRINITWDELGRYEVTLTVTDNAGKTGSVTETIFVGNIAPSAVLNVSPDEIKPTQVVTLNGAGSRDPDPEDRIAEYDWSVDNGDGTRVSYTGAEVFHGWEETGEYEVELVVTDTGGRTDRATQTVTVSNEPPEAAFTYTPTTEIDTATTVTLDATASSDPDGQIEEYTWEIRGGGETVSRNGETLDFQFDRPGSYTVTLTVSDGTTGEDSTSQEITVANRPPEPSFTTTPAEPTQYRPFVLDASGSTDPDGTIERYRWTVDTGSETISSSGERTELTIDEAGEVTVTLQVTDDSIGISTVSRTIQIAEGSPPATTPTPILQTTEAPTATPTPTPTTTTTTVDTATPTPPPTTATVTDAETTGEPVSTVTSVETSVPPTTVPDTPTGTTPGADSGDGGLPMMPLIAAAVGISVAGGYVLRRRSKGGSQPSDSPYESPSGRATSGGTPQGGSPGGGRGSQGGAPSAESDPQGDAPGNGPGPEGGAPGGSPGPDEEAPGGGAPAPQGEGASADTGPETGDAAQSGGPEGGQADDTAQAQPGPTEQSIEQVIEGLTSASPLATGGAVETYTASHQTAETPVTLYVLSADIEDEEAEQAFNRVVGGWRNASTHPNVVPVHDHGTEPRPWVAVNVHPDADELDRVANALRLEETIEVIDDVAEAVRNVALYGTNHFDLSPECVYVRGADPPVATVGNWGLNRAVDTAIGEARITPYTAPEQIDGVPDKRTDVYGIGAVAYYGLTGEPPVEADAAAIQAGEITPPSETGDVPPELDAPILTALSTDPEQRQDSVYSFAASLTSKDI